ncbi:MAG TPA: bifunctional molybdenum cofactor biosynthesis protein MoaC/MoaB, partial [Bacteroidetes bacterium]|nr:bifunctional molybdenum cofactor biosynthesis protein MoaC/MoaB [Bacteroidota bacterium]
MRDILYKNHTRRVAVAEAILLMKSDSVNLVQTNTGPKKDVLPTARAAGYLAVKNTPGAIPHCHPLPIENISIDFEFEKGEADRGQIRILIEVETIYKTGCEVEAMHGASLVALTIYDMLKPVDKTVEIGGVRLLRKRGGKSDFAKQVNSGYRAAVIVCSDSVSAGKKEDKAGKLVVKKLEGMGLHIANYTVIPDHVER